METNVPPLHVKRAIELAVGDRIARRFLPRLFGTGDPEIVFVKDGRHARESFVFVAVAYPDGYHDSTSFQPGAEIGIVPPGCDDPAHCVVHGADVVPVPAEDATIAPPARANEPWLNREPLGEAECGCPVYPYPEGRGSADDEIVDHRDTCTANDEERTEAVPF